METILTIIQIFIALTILNVWLIRARKKTAYRGKGASSLQNEFTAYGLRRSSVYFIGGLKVTLALVLLAGIWFPLVTEPALIGIGILMLGAVAMHLKVRDSFKRTSPSLLMLALTIILLVA